MSNLVGSIKSEISLATVLNNGLNSAGWLLSAEQQQRLLQYITLLDKWNKTYNLTAVREPVRMIGLHILDSLALLPHVGLARTMLDVGTGGGLPGLPLAIARPDMQITMLDSQQKKTVFIRQAICELDLKNAEVECARVKQFSPLEKFDIVVSRAFAELSDFVKDAAHLVAEDGLMFAMKGVYPNDEMARLAENSTMCFQVSAVIKLYVPQVEGERHLIVLKKVKEQADEQTEEKIKEKIKESRI